MELIRETKDGLIIRDWCADRKLEKTIPFIGYRKPDMLRSRVIMAYPDHPWENPTNQKGDIMSLEKPEYYIEEALLNYSENNKHGKISRKSRTNG